MSNLFVLSGPSGVGKTTLINAILKEKPNEVVHPLTYTTRPQRRGEANGRDMVFIPKAQFAPLLTQGKFLAHTEYGDEWYGTLAEDIIAPLQLGKKVIVAFDEHGVDCVRNGPFSSVNIYLYPKTIEQLNTWLLERWPEKGPTYEKRFQGAIAELNKFRHNREFANKFQYWLESGSMDVLLSAMWEIMGFYAESKPVA